MNLPMLAMAAALPGLVSVQASVTTWLVPELPRAVSALRSSRPDTHERIELAESLYQEETGRISGCSVSQPIPDATGCSDTRPAAPSARG